MSSSRPPDPPHPDRASEERLDSWKEIASYLNRDITTVQRWERREGMPVHRHVHDKKGSVYAFRSQLDTWALSRNLGPLAHQADVEGHPPFVDATVTKPVPPLMPPAKVTGVFTSRFGRPGRSRLWIRTATGILLASLFVASLFGWLASGGNQPPDNPLTGAHFEVLTDFGGHEHAATISRDGRFVAFLSDRDDQTDVWLTQIGSGRFHNLTNGVTRELVNPDVRTLGFSPDGTLVTFWTRERGRASPAGIGVWAVPVLGGSPRPYLEGVAEFDWSPDGTRLVFHTPGPGDPTYLREPGQVDGRQIFASPSGLHSHFPIWSPDQAFIYFVQGSLPDRLDIWRARTTGGPPERMTHHDAAVSHPAFLDARTLVYLATASDGSGPWLSVLDVARKASRRISLGAERYRSLAASADGRTLVATRAVPMGTLWRVPLVGNRVDMPAAQRIPLTTGRGFSPRLGADYLVYVSSKADSDSLWKLERGAVSEVFSAPGTRIVGAPGIARDGRIAFVTRLDGATLLHVANADGTDARVINRTLNLQGTLAWAPDGRSITVTAGVEGTPRLFSVPLDGEPPVQLVAAHSTDPLWSPDGAVVVYTGPDIGTMFPVKAARADGRPYPLPSLILSRGARRMAFLPESRTLVILRGDFRHKNLWLIHTDTGDERQLTDLPPTFEIRDFDISPDGRELVLEQAEDRSDVVLIESRKP